LLQQFWIVFTSEPDIAFRSFQAFMTNAGGEQGQGRIHIPAIRKRLIQ